MVGEVREREFMNARDVGWTMVGIIHLVILLRTGKSNANGFWVGHEMFVEEWNVFVLDSRFTVFLRKDVDLGL